MLSESFKHDTTTGNCIVVKCVGWGKLPIVTDNQGNTYTIVRHHQIGRAFGIVAVAKDIVGGPTIVTSNSEKMTIREWNIS